MIITKIFGGMGNQMFQYALGRHLAYKNQTELKLDVSAFKTYKLWDYTLGHFNIIENFATQSEIMAFNLKRKFNIFFGPDKKNILYFEKENFKFEPAVLNCRGNVYLEGYWQLEKYFKDIGEIIRKDFTFRDEPAGDNRKMLELIRNTNSVCLHIRRGDYITNLKANKIFGTCSVDYYNKSLEFIKQNLKEPHFFVFSDEPEWAKANIKTEASTVYVTHNPPDKGYEDFRLIKECKNFIIANSTFSWWGAWLAENKDKIVLAPAQWRVVNIDTADILPAGWLKIKV